MKVRQLWTTCWRRFLGWVREPLPPPGPDAGEALRHYQAGNRHFGRRAWDEALAEWRAATGLWEKARAGTRAALQPFLHLRAALALLVTVLVVYYALFALFPRNPFDMLVLTGNGMDARPFWERFLDTGRSMSGGPGHKMGIREWWDRFKQRFEGDGSRDGLARRFAGRPSVDERWEDLLRRYGRWGPTFNYNLDYNIVSGYGLSRLREYRDAVRVFEEGLAQTDNPNDLANLYQGLANTHYYQGYNLQPNGLASYDLQLVGKAKDAYLHAVRLQPRPVSLGNVGWMYYLLQDFRESESYSRRALEMDPNLDYVRLNLGLLYLVQGRVSEAFSAYREVISHNPPKDVYLGGINDLLELQRDYPGKHPFSHLMVGVLSMQSGDYTQARDSLTRFLSAAGMAEKWRLLARRLLAGTPAGEVLE